MNHLFLFTLGPVQGFIAQARKVHDLHSGSSILSHLCKEAATHFVEAHAGTVIFPDLKSASIPNRFLGKINNRTPEQLDEIGTAVAKAVQDAWKQRFDADLKGFLSQSAYEAAAQQITTHLDIQWLFETIADDSEAAWRQAYERLNSNMSALKNTRTFQELEETGRKCTLDGERNTIFYRKSFAQQSKTDEQLRNGNPLYAQENHILDYGEIKSGMQLRHLQPGEGLSAVSMLKRYWDFGPSDFPDTAEFALAETVHAVGQPFLKEMTKLFGHQDSRFLNWQLLYQDNLTIRYFEKQGLPPSKLEKATEIQQKLGKATSDAGRSLEKYYALVLFDGDQMGEWWRGTRLKPGEQLEVFHIDLTTRLAAFAQAIRDEFERDKSRGWVIYAGGDDFLGFFNLHHLTESIQWLHQQYQRIVHEPLAHRIQEGQFTFSAGVCIAHYKEPLSLVLDQARRMEKVAKQLREQKNALGLSVIPGSGQTAETVMPFEAFPSFAQVIADLQRGDFSSAFVSKARMELSVLIGADGSLLPDVSPAAKQLLDRAIGRACNLTQADNESATAFLERKKMAVGTLQKAVATLWQAADNRPLTALFDALDIADFIERQTHISTLQNTQAAI